MLCSELTIVKKTSRAVILTPLPCRRWTCEHCQPIRKRQLVGQAMSGHPDTFLTLTIKPSAYPDKEAAAVALVSAWRKIRREACRRYGYKHIPFMAFFEGTKAGWPHLHILLRVKWLDQWWLSERMEHHARSPIVDIRRIQSRRKAAFYVAKYAGKQPSQFGTLKRYWRSLIWDKRSPEEKEAHKRNRGDFEVWRMDLFAAAEVFRGIGYRCVCNSLGFFMFPKARGPT